jgi:hypothetical protein
MGPETSSSSSSLKPTRAAFIRGLPESMPIEEVIERGREAGISINPSDVHSARYYMRQQAASQSAKAASASAKAAIASEAAASSAADGTTTRRTVLWSVKPGRVPVPPAADPSDPDEKRSSASSASVMASAVVNGRGRKRGKGARAAAPSEAATAQLEGQLQVILLRVGSDRVKQIIARMESAERVKLSAKE